MADQKVEGGSTPEKTTPIANVTDQGSGALLSPTSKGPDVLALLNALDRHHEEQRNLIHESYRIDPLTKIPTEESFKKYLEGIINDRQEIYSEGHQTDPCTVIFADMNYFGLYNKPDGIGHDATDKLLCTVIDFLNNYLRVNDRKSDYIARRKRDAGDEFLIAATGFPAEPRGDNPGVINRLENFSQELRKKSFVFPSCKKRITNVSMAFGCYELDSLNEQLMSPDEGEVVVDTTESAINKADRIMGNVKVAQKNTEVLTPCITHFDGEIRLNDIDVEALFNERYKSKQQAPYSGMDRRG